MRLRRFSAANYKSIFKLDDVELTDGFNIVTGQNAAGKTALLELLSLSFPDRPHRSLKTVPNKGDITNPTSFLRAELQIKNEELKRILRNTKKVVWVPFVDPKSSFANQLGISDLSGSAVDRFRDWFTKQPEYSFKLEFHGTGVRSFGAEHSFLNYPMARGTGGQVNYLGFSINLNNQVELRGNQWTGKEDLGVDISPQLRQLVYRFSSERRIQARYPHGVSTQLAADASNLAEVLHVLQPDVGSFAAYNRLVSEILPQVQWVSIRPVQGANEIAIWNIKSKREDLAVSLDETGSGIGQVLAMVYVVFTSAEPNTIIIDEPQSFLHPSSAAKLIRVLSRFSQHQFVLATHSPSVMAAAGPSNIVVLTYDGETHAEIFGLNKAASFQSFLDAAGLEMQDTFGADNILWVEGPTEAKAFPEIIERLCKLPLMGTRVLPVSATGDLEGRDAERVFAVYRTLTQGNPILPSALAFVLDSETRTSQEIKQLVARSNDRAMFLPKRMFENYLLRPAAIAHAMNSIEGFSNETITEEEIDAAIHKKVKESGLFHPIAVQTDWEKTVNAGKLLASLFHDFSETRVQYRKTEHSVQLARWILENHPEDLSEIADVLSAAIKRKN
jgi:energy-coupling factor transporter ATP-binding protein EcfA2